MREPTMPGGEADEVGVWRQRASALNDGERFGPAERLVRRGLALFPGDAELSCELGRALSGQGRYEDARDALQESLARNPEAWFPRGVLGYVYSQMGNFTDAEECYLEVLKRHPRWAWAVRELGQIRYRRDDEQGARRRFEEALAIDPNDDVAHARLAYVLAYTRKTRRALAHAERALALDPQSSLAHGAMSYVLLQRGRAWSAREHALTALRLAPDDRALEDEFHRIDRLSRWIGYPAHLASLLVPAGHNPSARVAIIGFGGMLILGATSSSVSPEVMLLGIAFLVLFCWYSLCADRLIDAWVRKFPPRELR